MKARPLKRLAAIFGCTMVLAAAMPAFADDIAGDWLFDTSKFADNDCQIVGRMNEIRPVADIIAELVSGFEAASRRLDDIRGS